MLAIISYPNNFSYPSAFENERVHRRLDNRGLLYKLLWCHTAMLVVILINAIVQSLHCKNDWTAGNLFFSLLLNPCISI